MKDKRASIIYILLSLVLWQLMESLSKLSMNSDIQSDFLFSIVQTTNNGAAFGILENNSFILGILGVIVLILVSFYVFKNLNFNDKIKILASSIFSAGILGNTIQRFEYGYVIDFIKINFFNFPVFNLFDVLICLSVFIYIFFYVKEEIIK